MLRALHLCAETGIVVIADEDDALEDMAINPDGSGQFVEIVLRPHLTIKDATRAADLPPLHHRAHELCFISRSVNFPVTLEPQTTVAP